MTEENNYPPAPEGSIRLNKFLASCGYVSRRAADRLIEEGRVEVNGKAVDTPGLRVMPDDFVKVDGRHATPKEEIVLLLNKPRGYVCSREPQGAIGTVYDLLPPKYRHANYVGRLDADSEGLLIFTNNGSLGQSIGHPSCGIEKEYWVTLDQSFDNSVLIQLLKGVRIPEGQAKAKYVSRLSARRACVVLEQGLKRQIRQMFACLGLRVKKLVRVRIGSLWGGDLEPGNVMVMTQEQVELASVNPKRRKGLVGAKQAFKPHADTNAAHPAEPQDDGDDDNYEFDPADFETEEEALGSATKYEDGEAFEPERENSGRPFGRAPHSKRDFNDEGSREPRRSFGERKPFSNRGGFSRDGERRSFGDRKPFGERGFSRDGERRSFSDRKPFGERGFSRDGERRSFSDRKPFGERGFSRDGERRSFSDRKPFGERGFSRDGERRSFGERKSFGDRSFSRGGKRRSFSERKSFGDRKPSSGRTFGNRRPYNKGWDE